MSSGTLLWCSMWYYVLSIFVNYKVLTESLYKAVKVDNNDFLFHTNFDLVLTINYCCCSVMVTLTGLDRENVKADIPTQTQIKLSALSVSQCQR